MEIGNKLAEIMCQFFFQESRQLLWITIHSENLVMLEMNFRKFTHHRVNKYMYYVCMKWINKGNWNCEKKIWNKIKNTVGKKSKTKKKKNRINP